MNLARTGASIGQLSNVWGRVQPQRHYFMLAVSAAQMPAASPTVYIRRTNGWGVMSTLKRQTLAPGNNAENILQALCAICGVSFEGLVAELLARLAYCAHWRADNENPALTSSSKFLGER